MALHACKNASCQSRPRRKRPWCGCSLSLAGLISVSRSSMMMTTTVMMEEVTAFVVLPPCSFPRLVLRASMEEEGGIGVGIDLGTTYSAIAYLATNSSNGLQGEQGVPKPTIVPIPDNGRTMPSVVTFLVDGETGSIATLVGKSACRSETEAGGAYRNIKRILGTGGKMSKDVSDVVPFLKASSTGKTFKKDSMSNQVHDAREHPTLVKNVLSQKQKGDQYNIALRPEEISSHVLQTLKNAAETHTGQKVTRAVIGVPAYFHDGQRDATIKAAELAGIPKVKLLREPEAAALAYGVGKEQIGTGDQDELVLVFDLGGGTFDVSMLVVGGGVTEIISTSGNSQLGGSVFDARIARHCIKLLRKHGGVVIKKWSNEAKNAVVLSSEQIRINLSNNRKVNLALPIADKAWTTMSSASNVILPITYGDSEGEVSLENDTVISNSTHVLLQLTRKDMERLCKDEFQALLRPIREVAIMSEALLPGDSSPSIVEAALELEEEQAAREDSLAFSDFYDEASDERTNKVQKDEVGSNVLLELKDIDVRGAKKAQQRGRKRARTVAKQERKYRQEKRKLDESNPRPEMDNVKIRDGISGRPIGRVVLVGGATRMPAIGQLLTALTGVVPQKTVNPDEAVALGCAVHAGVLDGTEGMGTVLNPMQAAILRAVAMKQGFGNSMDDFEDGDFDSVEYY